MIVASRRYAPELLEHKQMLIGLKIDRRSECNSRSVNAMMVTIFRSDNIYRSMSALTSLIRLSAHQMTIMFFVSVSDVEPFISHADALVDALEDSNPEKQQFRLLVGLARASTFLYWRYDVPHGFAHDIRSRMIRLLHAYRYVLPLSNAQESRGDMTQVWRTRYTHHSQ